MKLATCLASIAALAVTAVVAQTPPPAPTAPPPAPAPEAAKAAPVAPAAMVDEARIVIEDKAKANGKIEIVFTAEGAAPTTVTVLVAEKMNAKEVAEDLAKNLTVTLGEGYKVDRNDEKIDIKAKNKKTFSVAVGSVTVPGMSVKIK